MGRSKCILDEKVDISEKYRVELKVFEIESDSKYPEGVKARFVLIDLIEKKPVLLIDNHAPFGFHKHEGLLDGSVTRTIIAELDYLNVLNEFRRLTMEFLKNEN